MLSDYYKHLLTYTGNPDQVAFAQRTQLREGKMEGLDVIDVDNGNGLHLWVLPGRCLDIGRLSLYGINISFLSSAGFSNSAYYDAAGMGGLDTFAPGFLATCGLRNSGSPCESNGEQFGFHGRIGQTPADSVGIYRDFEAPDPCIKISGRVREGRLFGAQLELYRTITVYLKENKIEIEDQITNLAALSEELMMLYHINLGYPFLTERAYLVTSYEYEKPADENARKKEGQRLHFKAPVAGEPENCFFYKQRRDENGEAYATCISEDTGLSVRIDTNPEELPMFCNWQSWAAGNYAMGISPCTCYGDGRAAHQERGQMVVLPPYESRKHHLTISFLKL